MMPTSCYGLLILALAAAPQQGQDYNPLDPDLRTQLNAARGIMEKERRIILASELNLTGEERDKFWDLYNDYVNDAREVNDLRVDVIVRYAENYRQMSDKLAKELVNDRFRHERELLKLRERYLKKMPGCPDPGYPGSAAALIRVRLAPGPILNQADRGEIPVPFLTCPGSYSGSSPDCRFGVAVCSWVMARSHWPRTHKS